MNAAGGCGEGEKQTHWRVWMCPNQDLVMDWMWPGEGDIKNNSLFSARASEWLGRGLRWKRQGPGAAFEEFSQGITWRHHGDKQAGGEGWSVRGRFPLLCSSVCENGA